MKKLHYDGPIVLVVMDGVGLSTSRSGNAVRQAHTEFLDMAMSKYLNIPLAASGEAVGIMPGQMGNSEVGHNALGAGQIIKQGIAGIEAAFQTGDIWQTKAWKNAIKYIKDNNGMLHFSGIFSDGGVHSDIAHLEQMIQRAYSEGVRTIRIHCVFDGRDVAPQSEPKYIERIEKFCSQFEDADFRIASGAGRMVAVADRYENDWDMVKLGWDMMVHGQAPRTFTSATEAIETFRREDPQIQDQYLPAFVVVENAAAKTPLAVRSIKAKQSSPSAAHGTVPVGPVCDGDAFIYYDFRADRAIEIARAFTEENFDKFDRVSSADYSPKRSEANSSDSEKTDSKHTKIDGKKNPAPKVFFAALTEYDSDRHVPQNILVPPIQIETPLNVFLGQNKISQLAISETVKFGHITYYFNGNSYKKAPLEEHIEIASDAMPFNTRPWMKSAETTDVVLENLDQFRFVRINYPGGDMVGHFAELEPTIVAMEAIDIQLARLAKKIDELGGMMIITADHGNAEELIDKDGIPRTSHTTNPVPCIFYDNTDNARQYKSAKLSDAGLTNIAATVSILLGLPDYPASWRDSLIAL